MSVIADSELGLLTAREYPALAPALDGMARRSLLKAIAASLAMAGLTGCDFHPDDKTLPYVNAPENVHPSKPKLYATAVTLNGFALPVLGKTYSGRPVKLEGNPDHPYTAGATDPFLQASLLGLYDPQRSKLPRNLGRPASWDAFEAAMFQRAAALDRVRGEGFRLLTGRTTSPTMVRQIAALTARWPNARWHVHEPVDDDAPSDATRQVFGRRLQPQLMLDRAELIVSLDDDVMAPGPRQAALARRWGARRRAFQRGEGGSRMFVAEPIPSLAGIRAEERLKCAPQDIGALTVALAEAVGVPIGATLPPVDERAQRWVKRAAAALSGNHGRAVVTLGPWHDAGLHAAVLLINERIGALGTTLQFTEPVAAPTPAGGSLDDLVADMQAGRVGTLAVIGANPAYTAPGDIGFAQAMENVELRIHAGLQVDETATRSHWHVPLQHELETWSDARAADGTAGIIQPLVRPFYAVRSQHAIIENLLGRAADAHDLVQETWRAAWNGGFAQRWPEALYRGFVPGSTATTVVPTVVNRAVTPAAAAPAQDYALVIRPDPAVWDGRFAGIAWLQELPKPVSKVTWGNVIAIGPGAAARHSLKLGDRVQVAVDGGTVTGPVYVQPGQDDRTIHVTLGYGQAARDRAGLGADLGYDAYRLRRRDRLWIRHGAILTATGDDERVATTQLDHAMDGYEFVRTVPTAGSEVHRTAPREKSDRPSFYPPRNWDRPSWGMSIDLDLCIGCNACVVACIAENNVPMVGKELVSEGREMLWLRVDHYTEGDAADPKFHFQPVPCMHCEQAPCEMACPVNAAVHSDDGLNLQVYNRCIGTRTCSAYCPYKVRRFNWFDFTSGDPEPMRAMRNPEVTVRARGVMEKCTYCLQRIRAAKITADIEGREIADGEVVTACQQACPTKAIVFGDILDPEAEVVRRKASPRDYELLEEANTWPRTTYLAKITGRGETGEG